MYTKTKFLGLFHSKKPNAEVPIDTSLVCVYNVSPDEQLNQIQVETSASDPPVGYSSTGTVSASANGTVSSGPVFSAQSSSHNYSNPENFPNSFSNIIKREENAIEARPELKSLPRVVSLSGAISEAILMMGLEGILVGRSHDCSRIPAIQHVPCVSYPAIGAAIQHLSSAAIESIEKERAAQGLSKYNLNERTLSECNPDLILIQDVSNAFGITLREFKALCADYLSRLDHAVRIVAIKPTTVSDVWESIKTIGDLVGQPEAGENVARKLIEKFAYIRNGERFRKNGSIPRVICLQWLDPLTVSGFCVPEIVSALGGKALLAQSGKPPTVISFDAIVKLDPEFMVIMCNGFSIERTEHEMAVLQGHKEWSKLKCVSLNKVFIVDGLKFFNSMGPAIVDSGRIMQEILFGNSSNLPTFEGVGFVRFNGLVKTNLSKRPRPPGKAQVQSMNEDQEAELARHRGSMRNALRGFKHMFKFDSGHEKSSRSKEKGKSRVDKEKKDKEKEVEKEKESEDVDGNEKLKWGIITEGVDYVEILQYNEKFVKKKQESLGEEKSQAESNSDHLHHPSQVERLKNLKRAGFILLDQGKNGINGESNGISAKDQNEEDEKNVPLSIPHDGIDYEPNSAEFGSETSEIFSEKSPNINGGKNADFEGISDDVEEALDNGMPMYFRSRETLAHDLDSDRNHVVNLLSGSKVNDAGTSAQDPSLMKSNSVDSDRDVSECSSETDRDDLGVLEGLNTAEQTDAMTGKLILDSHGSTFPHKASIIHSKASAFANSDTDTSLPFGSVVITGKPLSLRNLIMDVVRSILPCSCILVSGGFSSSIIVECAKFLEKESGHGIGCGITVLAGSKASDRYHVEKLSERCGLKLIKTGLENSVKVFDVLKSELPFVVHTLRSFDPLEVRCGLALSYALKEAKKNGFDRVIIGDGADELFTGYDFMQNMDEKKLLECRSHMFSVMKFPATVLGRALGIEVIQPFLHPSIQKFALELSKEDLLGNMSFSTASSPTSFPSPAPSSPSHSHYSASPSSPNSSPSFPRSSPATSPSLPMSSTSASLPSSSPGSLEEGNTFSLPEGKLILRHSFPDVYAVNRRKDSVEVGSGLYVLQRRICHKISPAEFKSEKKRIRSEDRVRLRDPEHLHYYKAFRQAFGGPEIDGFERYVSDDSCVACGYPPNFPDQLFCAICGEYPARKISPLKGGKSPVADGTSEMTNSPAETDTGKQATHAHSNDESNAENNDLNEEGNKSEKYGSNAHPSSKERSEVLGESSNEVRLEDTLGNSDVPAHHETGEYPKMEQGGTGFKSKLAILVESSQAEGHTTREVPLTYVDSKSATLIKVTDSQGDDELGLGSEGDTSMIGLLESIDSGLESWSAFLGEDVSSDWGRSLMGEV